MNDLPDLHIERMHNLGIENARKITDEWIADAQKSYGLTCKLERTDLQDTVTFKRVGASGQIISTATTFKITAKLGFLFKSFLPKIEDQINLNLDKVTS